MTAIAARIEVTRPGMRRHFAIAQGFEADVEAALARRERMEANGRPQLSPGCVWLDEARPQDLYAIDRGVALIAIRGVLFDELEFHGASWATGYNAIRLAAALAVNDPDVKALALDIDSGGGMVAGCFELCDWLRAAGEQKPLTAIVKFWAASAAYAILSACKEATAPQTGGVGSIGVVMMHLDISQWLAEEGLKVTLIQAGKHKTDGNMFEALPAEVKAEWQETCEAYRTMFADTVAAGRPGLTAAAALATEARFYEGPIQMQAAHQLGLIDALMDPADALDQLIAAIA